jgi:hypothetical protein
LIELRLLARRCDDPRDFSAGDGFVAACHCGCASGSHKEMGAGIAASPHMRRAKDLPVFVT